MCATVGPVEKIQAPMTLTPGVIPISIKLYSKMSLTDLMKYTHKEHEYQDVTVGFLGEPMYSKVLLKGASEEARGELHCFPFLSYVYDMYMMYTYIFVYDV